MRKISKLIICMMVVIVIPLSFNACAVFEPGTPYAGKNIGNPLEPSRRINRATPPRRDNTRYLDSNKKKKKKWTKIKAKKGSDCPSIKTYSSKSLEKVRKKEGKGFK